MDKERFRELLDECNIMSRVDPSGDILVVYEAEDGRNIAVIFVVTENFIQMRGLFLAPDIPSLKEEENQWVFEFCNKWNMEKVFPKAYSNKYVEKIMGEATYFSSAEHPLSDEYIKSMIILPAASIFSPLEEAVIEELKKRGLLLKTSLVKGKQKNGK